MAYISTPIQVNLPDDWIEQIVERLRNDPNADWVEIVRCKDCKHYGESLPDVDTRMICHKTALNYKPDDFCSYAERREDVDVKP